MSQTSAALLSAVEDAILAVTKGQEFRLGDKWLTRANLSELMKTRDTLKVEVARSNGGAVVTAVTFEHGR